MDKVSVIIPVYNSEKTLRDCVYSVLNQTYFNLDIILVDDGSTDRSGMICDEFAEKDLRIRVVHKENGGVVSARKAGIQILSNEGFTTFCDSDDRMVSDAVEKLYRCITTERADMACGNLQRFFGKGIRLKANIPLTLSQKRCYTKEEIQHEILPSFFGITSFTGYMHTKMYKNFLLKKVLGFYCPEINFQEDVAFNLIAVILSERIATIPDIVYLYRMGGCTNRYMPTFLDDCISLYNFKMAIIKQENLSADLQYTTEIELKNEFSFWLQMNFKFLKGHKNKDIILEEIKRCCDIPEIIQAVNCCKDDHSGISGFKKLAQTKSYDEIFDLIAKQNRKSRARNMVKSILQKI